MVMLARGDGSQDLAGEESQLSISALKMSHDISQLVTLLRPSAAAVSTCSAPALSLSAPSTPPYSDRLSSSPMSQPESSSSSCSWSASAAALTRSRASSEAEGLFTAPLHSVELPSFAPLSGTSSPSPSASHGVAGDAHSHSDDADADASLLRSKRRKLEEIPSRERWRCPNDGCGREYKRTSTTSIGQHKESCSKRPVLQARPIFQLNPTAVRRVEFLQPANGVASAVATPVVTGRVEPRPGSFLQSQTTQALLAAQQQLQQQTQQALQAQLLQQQQALLQQQQQRALSQGGLGLGLSLPPQGFSASGFQPAPLPYSPLVTMTLSALNEQLLGLSSSSSLRPPAVGVGMGPGIGQGGSVSQASSPLTPSMRSLPSQSLWGAPQPLATLPQSGSSYGVSVNGSFPSSELHSLLLSDLPLYPLPSQLGHAAPLQTQVVGFSTSPQSLMKPVARRMEDGSAGGVLGQLPSLTLQQLAQLGRTWA